MYIYKSPRCPVQSVILFYNIVYNRYRWISFYCLTIVNYSYLNSQPFKLNICAIFVFYLYKSYFSTSILINISCEQITFWHLLEKAFLLIILKVRYLAEIVRCTCKNRTVTLICKYVKKYMIMLRNLLL